MNDTALLQARSLLRTLTPLKADCGRVCGCACCQGSDLDGMLLFPGEDALYKESPHYALHALDQTLCGIPLTLFVCDGTCIRDERPLACRLFPLLPTFDAAGSPVMRMDPRARSVCPLYSSGVSGLAPDFVRAALEATHVLLEDPACARFLRALDAQFRL